MRSKTIWRETNSTGQICRQANSSVSQFGGIINNFDLPLLALKRQQKLSCYVTEAIKKDNCNYSTDKSENSHLKLSSALNLGMFLAEHFLFEFTIA